MVGNFGEVQVMDWGLAKVLLATSEHRRTEEPTEADMLGTEIRTLRDSDGSYTQDGSVIGTPAYMPPEQAGGETDRIDQRSDVFSLGAILCVILTGQPPYTGKDAEVVRRAAMRGKLDDAFARLDASGAEPGLIALAKSCMKFEPAERFRDASVVAARVAALREMRNGAPAMPKCSGPKPKYKPPSSAKRRKVQLALATSVLTLFVVAGGGAWWMDRQAAERTRIATQRETERQIEAARNRQAIDAELDKAEAALRKENPVYGEIDVALSRVEQWLPVEGLDDARSRFQSLTTDRRMLVRLDEIDKRRWALTEDRRYINAIYGQRNYPIAFRDYGIDVDRESTAEAARKVQNSPIRIPLMAALDAWLTIDSRPPGRLLDLVNALDPDPERWDLRSALVDENEPLIAESVAELDGRKLPPAFAQFVGSHLLTPQEHAIRILTSAQVAHPDHFGLAVETALRFPDSRPDEKVVYWRIALAIRPENAMCYMNLASALYVKKDLDGALATSKEAIRLDPKTPFSHNLLGTILYDKKDLDGASTAYKEAIRLDPKFAEPRVGLSNILNDRDEPAAALQFLSEGTRVNPDWMDDFETTVRYCSACYAARAGTGQGKDVPPESDRPQLRKKALDWLAADLAARRETLNDAKAKPVVHETMTDWLNETDLVAVRDEDKLKMLPADERKAWEQLWADVRKLRDESLPELLPLPKEVK